MAPPLTISAQPRSATGGGVPRGAKATRARSVARKKSSNGPGRARFRKRLIATLYASPAARPAAAKAPKGDEFEIQRLPVGPKRRSQASPESRITCRADPEY